MKSEILNKDAIINQLDIENAHSKDKLEKLRKTIKKYNADLVGKGYHDLHMRCDTQTFTQFDPSDKDHTSLQRLPSFKLNNEGDYILTSPINIDIKKKINGLSKITERDAEHNIQKLSYKAYSEEYLDNEEHKDIVDTEK